MPRPVSETSSEEPQGVEIFVVSFRTRKISALTRASGSDADSLTQKEFFD